MNIKLFFTGLLAMQVPAARSNAIEPKDPFNNSYSGDNSVCRTSNSSRIDVEIERDRFGINPMPVLKDVDLIATKIRNKTITLERVLNDSPAEDLELIIKAIYKFLSEE